MSWEIEETAPGLQPELQPDAPVAHDDTVNVAAGALLLAAFRKEIH